MLQIDSDLRNFGKFLSHLFKEFLSIDKSEWGIFQQLVCSGLSWHNQRLDFIFIICLYEAIKCFDFFIVRVWQILILKLFLVITILDETSKVVGTLGSLLLHSCDFGT